jgi:putative NIF3 family GTP cyclohydrolase 1 type 2
MPTRRGFLTSAGALAGSGLLRSQPSLTVGQVMERIQKNLGVPWRTPTVDTLKAGTPDTPVRGIATTMMATFDVLQRAAKANCNFVITHEPTFYNHEDATTALTSDPVYAAKRAFLEKNGMAVMRFHDNWHARRPDGIRTGMLQILGWDKFQSDENPRALVMPETTLAALASDAKARLKGKAIRVIGDPKMKVRRVAINPGYMDLNGALRSLSRTDLDVMVIGEAREWEGISYVQDAITAGRPKGLIVLGHVISEENGMNECARWLKTFVSEVPVEFIAAGEPFWSPQE